MTRENSFKKSWKKALLYFLSGALAFGILVNQKCDEEPPQKPVAILTANPTQGDAPLYVEFDGSRSQGAIEKYIWNFGEGNTDLTTLGPYTNYTYEKGGKYNPSLIVVDNQWQESNKASLEIIVNEDVFFLGKIAFMNQNQDNPIKYEDDIYSGDIVIKDEEINLKNIKRLTTDPGQDLEPAWSPDGNEILFTTNRNKKIAVWRMNEDGTNQRDISSHLVEHAYQADWGNNGKIVVAYRDFGDTVAGIGMIDPEMNFFTPIYTEAMSSHIPGWPKWSPDCSKIVFQKYINENWEIFLMNADGTNLRNLTNNFAIDQSPVFFSNKKMIWWSDRANPHQSPIEADLYLMNLNGSNITRLTYASGGELDPVISPDKKYLLFTSFKDLLDPFQLYLTELTNANNRGKWIKLTKEGENRYPAWKPKIEN